MGDFCHDFPLLRRVLDRADRMDHMIARCGVDPGVAVRREGGASWYEARTRCIDCPGGQLCRQWLEDGSPGPRRPPRFCPNAGFLAACLDKQSGSHGRRQSRAPA